MKTFPIVCALMFCASPAIAQVSLPPSLDGYSYQPSVGDAPPEVEIVEDHRRTGSVWVLRGGAFSGAGRAAERCDGDGCPESLETTKYRESSSYALSADWLVNSSRNFRIGAGFGFIPELEVEESGERFELGSVASTDLVLEGVVDLSKKMALTLRGRVGMSLLFPSGDLKDEGAARSEACASYEVDYAGTCETDRGPYFGAQAGAGPGLLVNLGRFGLRVDFEVQAYTFRTLETQFDGAEAAVQFSGVRPMLLAGIEL